MSQISIKAQNQNEKLTNYEITNSYNITDKEILDINPNSKEHNKRMEFKNYISNSNLPENANTNIDGSNIAILPIININNSNNTYNPIIHSQYNNSDNLNNNINNISNPNNFTFCSGN